MCTLAALIVLITVPVACGSQSGRVLLRVEGQPITESDLEHELIVQEGARQLLLMIDLSLITRAAAQQQITISDGDLDLKYQQAAARIGSERDLEEQLKRSRRTKLEFREELRAEALLDRLAQARNPVDEADVRQYYDNHKQEFSHGPQVRMRLMLFTTRPNADTVAEALKDPQADFAGLAQAFSEDPSTKDKGGDTGFVERGDYAKEIGDMAFKLPPGQPSGVFAVPDGFAIIRVEEKRPAGFEPYTQVKESVAGRVALEQLEVARHDWLKEARARAQIVIPDAFLEAQVRKLIDADTPFEPSNLAPQIPMAPR
ncbi:MAG: peptidyl-prolyl cis-trans isomerase [Armatimonadota bacterium]